MSVPYKLFSLLSIENAVILIFTGGQQRFAHLLPLHVNQLTQLLKTNKQQQQKKLRVRVRVTKVCAY